MRVSPAAYEVGVAAAIRAEMAAGTETGMGELGFLQHDVDTVDTEKQDL